MYLLRADKSTLSGAFVVTRKPTTRFDIIVIIVVIGGIVIIILNVRRLYPEIYNMKYIGIARYET